MCDNPISEKINITSKDKDEIPAANMNVEYKGKTTGMTTSLKSRPKSTILITDKTTFETVGDICDKKDYLEAKGILTLQHILFGPLDTYGSKLTFENMYFHFKDLKLNLIVKFFYNPLSICREAPDPNAKKDYSITFEIDKTKSENVDKGPVDLKLFYATNGKSSDINSLFYDLEEDFKNYYSGFSSFYDYFITQIAGSSQFVRKIEDEFKNIYCKNQKDQNQTQKVKNPYVLYKQKIDILKRLDIYSTIYSSKS